MFPESFKLDPGMGDAELTWHLAVLLNGLYGPDVQYYVNHRLAAIQSAGRTGIKPEVSQGRRIRSGKVPELLNGSFRKFGDR